MATLTYSYRGIPGRVDPNRPVAAIVDPAKNVAFDGAAWVADITKAKRYPMVPALGDPGLYLLSVAGTWPAGAWVLAYDLATDATPAGSGLGVLPGGSSPDPPTSFTGTISMSAAAPAAPAKTTA